MPPIAYFKAEPTEYVRFTSNGKTTTKGQGAAGFYLPFRTSIELVSVATADHPFAFKENSQNNQEVTFNGGIIFQVTDPEAALKAYNFAVNPRTRMYVSEDADKLKSHLVDIVRANTRKIALATDLEPLLLMADELSDSVSKVITSSERVKRMGLTVDALYFGSIVPKPEIAKALEANYREALLIRADKSTYERRASAVEQERQIRQNEMATSIDIENRRAELVTLEAKNTLAAAEAQAEAHAKGLAVFDSIPVDRLRALALYEIGKNADKIGTLNVTPELLAGIAQAVKG